MSRIFPFRRKPARRFPFAVGVGGGIVILVVLCNSTTSHAQTSSPITSSGLGTQVSGPLAVGSKTQFNITGGTRPSGGTNLFHSFGEFGVPENNIANFLNDSGLVTSNILGRVTGGNISSVYGSIQTTGFGNANLFLMNPAGFLFGPGATVNIGGMISFTSADYLRLADEVRFNASQDTAADALLTPSPVAAFGFLGNNPGAITVQGTQLTVTAGTAISLVGGNITLESSPSGFTANQPALLRSPGGQINIASVNTPGEISTVDYMPPLSMVRGDVAISQDALLDVSDNAAGTIRIRAGKLSLDNATLSADTQDTTGAATAIDIHLTGNLSMSDTRGAPMITARTSGLGDAGEVSIVSNSLDATSSVRSLFSPDTHFALIDSHTSGSGKSGNVKLQNNGDINATGQATGPMLFIDSGTLGPGSGQGGDVTITANNMALTDAYINSGDFPARATGQEAGGSGGNVIITADTLSLNHALIATDGWFVGRAGDLTISARDIQMTSSQLSLLEFGGGGALEITADRLITDFSQIEVETVDGQGLGNPWTAITITGSVVEFRNGTTLRSQTVGDGNAGDIHITASDHLTLADRFTADPNDPATLGAKVRPTGLFTNSLGDLGNLGKAGAIIVTTPRLDILGGARINSTTRSSGHGGDVSITANEVTVSGERPDEVFEQEEIFAFGSTRASGIYTRTIGNELCTGACGDAGNVSISTTSFTLNNGGVVNSGTTNDGQGGDVIIRATDIMSISGTMADGTSGGIFSQTIGGEGNGGNIELQTGQFQLVGGAKISASTLGAGSAGTVTIEGTASPAQSVLLDGSGSGVFTNTEGIGTGGNILVNANSVTLQNGGTLSAATTGTAPSATGGTINVNANQVQVNSGGLITASTTGAGDGGSVNINAASTFASNAGTVSSTATQATGGDINISAGQSVTLDNGSLITASSNGEGNAGNIVINAGQSYTSTNSSVTTKAEQASGGNITVLATGLVHLTNSELNASVEGSSTTVGGNILIDPLYVILENSQIVAQATQGQGGNINISYTGAFLVDSSSVIDASSQFGQSGTVTIQSPISPASGKIIPIGQKPLMAAALMSQRCAALAGGSISSFTVGGRDALPAEPGNWLPSPLALAAPSVGAGLEAKAEGSSGLSGLSGFSGETHTINKTNEINQTNESPLLSLRQLGPTGFLTQVFAVVSDGCQS